MSARPAIQSHHRGRYRKGIYYHRALRSPVEKKEENTRTTNDPVG